MTKMLIRDCINNSKLLALCCFIFSQFTFSQIQVLPSKSSTILKDIRKIFSDGLTISNLQHSDSLAAFGTFYDPNSLLGLTDGLLMSTGKAADAVGPNNRVHIGTDFNTPGDPDLNSLTTETTTDAAFISFDFIPAVDTLYFTFVFASEEYDDVGTAILDMFGVFIKYPGYFNYINVATLPGVQIIAPFNPLLNCGSVLSGTFPSRPIFVDQSTNRCLLNDYYIYNPYMSSSTQFNAFLTPITLKIPVRKCMMHALKIVIADSPQNDGFKDSGVFIKSGTLGTQNIVPFPTSINSYNDSTFACTGNEPILTHSITGTNQQWFYNHSFLGTQNFVITSALGTGMYRLVQTISGGCVTTDSIFVKIGPVFVAEILPDTFLCKGGFITLSAAIVPKNDSYQFRWNLLKTTYQSTLPNPTWYLDTTRVVMVQIKNQGGCYETIFDTLRVNPVSYHISLQISDTVGCAPHVLTISSTVNESGCTQYYYTDTTFYWHSTTGASQVDFSNSSVSDTIALGFDFDFYCNRYKNVFISKNGFITFERSQVGVPTMLGDTQPPNNLIAICGVQTTESNPNFSVTYQTVGPIGQRIFIVSYVNAILSNSFDINSFTGQIKLFEGTNHIELHTLVSHAPIPVGASQGIENASTSRKMIIKGRNNIHWSTQNEAFVIRNKSGTYTTEWFKNREPWQVSTHPILEPLEHDKWITYTLTDSKNCRFSDSVFVKKVAKKPTIQKNYEICAGDSLFVSISGANTFQWNTSVPDNYKNSGSFYLKPTPGSTYMVRSGWDFPRGCYHVDTLHIRIHPTPNKMLSKHIRICKNESHFLTIPGTFAVLGNVTYSGTGFLLPSVSYDTSIVLKVYNSKGCATADTLLIIPAFPPVLQVSNDTTVCAGSMVWLKANGADTYRWFEQGKLLSVSDVKVSLVGAKTTQVVVIGKNHAACSATDTITIWVKEPELSKPYIQANTREYCPFGNYPLELQAAEGKSYLWQFAGVQHHSKTLTVTAKGMYFVTITGPNDCPVVDSILIVENCKGEIRFPNIISPNGDGFNDYFEVQGLKPNTKFQVFNRWGTLLYEQEDYQNNWDAYKLHDGIYYVTLSHPEYVHTFKGWLQVLR